MPFRVAGWSGNIFFGFSSLRGINGEGPVRRGFQAIERAEKWQTFSVTLRKVSMVTGEAVLVLIEEKGFNRRDRGEKPECAERNHSKREAVPQQNAEPPGLHANPQNISAEDFSLRSRVSLGDLCG
jgi:hypothetical protein